jgi:hypothetical protein
MLQLGNFTLCRLDSRIAIATVLAFLNPPLFKIDEFLRIPKDVGGGLIHRHRQRIAQALLTLSAMHGTGACPL